MAGRKARRAAGRGAVRYGQTLISRNAGLWYFPSQANTPTPAPYPNNPYLTGGSVFAFWGQVQTGPSTYSWTVLDSLVAAWTGVNKRWALRMNGYTAASGYAGSPSSTPMWLMDSAGPIYNLSKATALGGGNYSNNGRGSSAPSGPAYDGTTSGGVRYCIDLDGTLVPAIWDAAYIAAFQTFAQAVHDRYASTPPSFVQLGVGHAGETYPIKQLTANPCASVTATATGSGSTLAAGTWFGAVVPLYGTGATGAPPRFPDTTSPATFSVTTTGTQTIAVSWTAPAVTTIAPLTITGYWVLLGNAAGSYQYFYYQPSGTSYTITAAGSAYTSRTGTNQGLQYRMLDMMGLSGDQTLMGNSALTASTTFATFYPSVGGAIATAMSPIFDPVPCTVLTVNSPGGSSLSNMDTAILAVPNTYVQNDALTPTSAADQTHMALSINKNGTGRGFAVYEEGSGTSVPADLVAEANLIAGVGVKTLIVFPVACDAMVPASPTYNAAMAQAGSDARAILIA